MKPILCFDIEATGPDPALDRIVQLSISGDGACGTWIFNPGRQMSAEVISIHGITNEMVEHCPPFKDQAANLYYIFKQYDLLGFNLSNFDVPILWEEFYRCGIEWDLSDTKLFDAGTLFKRREERTLSAAVQFYCGREHTDAHDAAGDVAATWDVWKAQLKRYGLEGCDRDRLAKESSFDEVRVDLAGKIIVGKDGRPTYNIGKVKGTAVDDDHSFAHWMLDKDFSANTKMHLLKILNAEPAEPETVVSSDDMPW